MTLLQIRRFILSLTFLLLAGSLGYWLGKNDFQFSSAGWQIQLTNKKSISLPRPVIVNQQTPADKSTIDFSLFWEVWDRLDKTYLEKKDLDPQKMFYGAVSGMVSALGDPYTVFLPPSENKTVREDLNGSLEGVGIQLGYKNGNQLAVVAPLEGLPAKKAGVKAGDLILHLKDASKNLDQDLKEISLTEAVKLIRGPKNTTVTLTLLHENENKAYVVDLVRETIVVPSVELKFGELAEGKWQEDVEGKKNGKVAWLRLTRFGDLTDAQWDKAVGEINTKCKTSEGKCAGIVLDLRNNPGGYLDGAVNLAAEFLPEGDVVVKQENNDNTTQEYKVKRAGRLLEIPLVALINKGSASASEILVGALRDQKRLVKIVGEKSFGKGTVQEAMELRGGAGLHITTAKWILPEGQWVHKEGIKPDIEVSLDEKDLTRDLQLEKAAEVLLK